MAVKIRMSRHGSKKRPFYRIVVADSRAPRDGKYIEQVGTYDPLSDPPKINLKDEKIAYWIAKGAIPSDTVKQIMKKAALGKAGVAAA